MAAGEGADINVPFEKKMFSRGNAKCRKQIRKHIESGNYDAILLNTSLAAFHVRLALPRRARPRVVNLVHGYLFSEHVGKIKSLLLRCAEWFVRGKTDAIITMNEYDFRYATAKKLTRGRVYASHGMGVRLRDTQSDVRDLRSQLASDEKTVFTFVGELSARKNQEFLVRAHKKILSEIPNAVLWLVGDGGERERLGELCRELGIFDSVIFTGQRTDACDLMRATDVYVSASSIEGLPFNIIEALGVGSTVVASRIKGHTDIITDGENGYLFAFGDMDEYVKKAVFAARGGTILPEKAISAFKKYEFTAAFDEMLGIIKESLYG
jgi:glycosyltransferase EpsD